MPLLVSKLIYTIVPGRAPFFIRPIARLLFDGLTKQMVDPRIKLHADYVRQNHRIHLLAVVSFVASKLD